MAYSDYNTHDRYDPYSHDHRRPRHDAYHADYYQSSHVAADNQTAMNYTNDFSQSTSRPSNYRHSYESRYSSTAKPARHRSYRRNRWPPSPSVEDEAVSLAKEFPTLVGSEVEDTSVEARTRGSVDQNPVLVELEQYNDERRFVIVTDPDAQNGDYQNGSTDPGDRAERDRRRRSFARRGKMAPLDTSVNDPPPPVFTERTPTPYAYVKPQKESLAPSGEQYFLSPEPITPSSSNVPRSIPNQIPSRDRDARNHDLPLRTHSSRTSTNADDAIEDSGEDSDNLRIPIEPRRSGRYSFSKSEIQKEDLRANVLESQARTERRKPREHVPSFSSNRESSGNENNASPISPKHYTARTVSPRSSSSSLAGESRRHKPPPADATYTKSSRKSHSRPSSRPVSPSQQGRASPPRSPRLSSYGPSSPTASRPSSRNGPRPSSPSSLSNNVPRADIRVPVTESDWHARYSSTTDRSRPTPRHDHHDFIEPPMPHINVKSPSPARAPTRESTLPYPVDDQPTQAFMPPEEHYQYDHSSSPVPPSPRQPYAEYFPPSSPRTSTSHRPRPRSYHSTSLDEIPGSPRGASNSFRPQSYYDSPRDRRPAADLGADRPLPTCPRGEFSSQYDDWFVLEGTSGFHICPDCYQGVFADTHFAGHFSQPRYQDRSRKRKCNFSSPWTRIAWVIILQQRRTSLRLMQDLSKVADTGHGCPGDRELSTDRIDWYGIPGEHVNNFAICPCDFQMLEILFPTIRNYFTLLPHYNPPITNRCSFRANSKRSRKYLDLLMELDTNAQVQGQRPNMEHFERVARENAFKNECTRDKPIFSKLWHFMPELPEFTVCEECYQECVWPYLTSPSRSSLPGLFNPTIQFVPGEDPEMGNSCCLYSKQMREVWGLAVEEGNFGKLRDAVLERRKMQIQLENRRRNIHLYMQGFERGSAEWERSKEDLNDTKRWWKGYE